MICAIKERPAASTVWHVWQTSQVLLHKLAISVAQDDTEASLLSSLTTRWIDSSKSLGPTPFACRRLKAVAFRFQVTDITYIKTHEGWLYLAVVIDLFSGRVIGWSAQSRMTTDLALQALLAAVWRRKPKHRVMIHSPSRGLKANRCQAADQGSQFTSRERQTFLSQHNLDASMSRRGSCYDNAVAESFFHLLKRERIRRKTYQTREAARQHVFEYIEMFYNPKRKHTNNGMLSPVDFETRQQKLNEAGV